MWADIRAGAILVSSAIVALSLQSSFASVLAPHPAAPYVLVPMVVALATAMHVRLSAGALTTFVLGCVMDGMTGNALGTYTFTFVFAYILLRAAALRFFARSVVLEAILSAAAAIVVGTMVSVIRAGFRSFEGTVHTPTGWPVLWAALATALISPLVTSWTRRWLPRNRSAAAEVVA